MPQTAATARTWCCRWRASRAGLVRPDPELTDRIARDNATLLPTCRKPPLTLVLYLDTVNIRAGAAWSIRGLSSTLLNEAPASGGQKFHDPAESLSSRAEREFGDSLPASTRQRHQLPCSWPFKPSTQGLSRVRCRCPKNFGAVMATAKMRRLGKLGAEALLWADQRP